MSLYGSTVCQQFNVGCYPPLVVQPFIRWTRLLEDFAMQLQSCENFLTVPRDLGNTAPGHRPHYPPLTCLNKWNGGQKKGKKNLKGKVRHWKHRCKKKNHLWLKRKDQDKKYKREVEKLFFFALTPAHHILSSQELLNHFLLSHNCSFRSLPAVIWLNVKCLVKVTQLLVVFAN